MRQYLQITYLKRDLYLECATLSIISLVGLACYHLKLLHFFFNFYFYFILLYNTVLVLAYIDMNPPWVYMSSQS